MRGESGVREEEAFLPKSKQTNEGNLQCCSVALQLEQIRDQYVILIMKGDVRGEKTTPLSNGVAYPKHNL